MLSMASYEGQILDFANSLSKCIYYSKLNPKRYKSDSPVPRPNKIHELITFIFFIVLIISNVSLGLLGSKYRTGYKSIQPFKLSNRIFRFFQFFGIDIVVGLIWLINHSESTITNMYHSKMNNMIMLEIQSSFRQKSSKFARNLFRLIVLGQSLKKQ
ncbi:hypothetical protein BpHYR1_000213 [Brachionus plicatilis]|uniref:Uncharacterized protein n=1 Tax=Brachionus plicatilis TaxID=10195 RepID=A0A3M7SD61_BRAPC|nr:hypothetical protein BpHYR1_000213 [Brachionus plicatilis]